MGPLRGGYVKHKQSSDPINTIRTQTCQHTFEILDVCYRNVDPLKQMFFRDLNLSPHYAFRFLDGGGWTGRTQ